jgi:hypothetical protein
MKEETRNKIAYYSIFIALLSLLISAVNIYELHFSGSKLRIESFESYKEHVSFILYNAGREPAFIKQLSIEELGLDKRPIRIIARSEYKKGENPFPEVTLHEDITIEPKSSIKVEGKIPYRCNNNKRI